MVRESELIEATRLAACLEEAALRAGLPEGPEQMATLLVEAHLLTRFQASQLLKGRWRGFVLGKYRLLDWIGSGGMGQVYLAEHVVLNRLAALKVLPLQLARDPWFLENFYKEARAVAALNHANIVRAHDIDQSGNLHFLVMEYVDGASFQHIVNERGPLDFTRAAHYVSQAALGLQHAHEVGLVHRDIKPGNLLLNRQGIVKILDMGLACFARRACQSTGRPNGFDRRVVGTDDYLAPEQVVDSDDVDIRADIYGLGATFYFLLTGQPPFGDVSLPHHKLISHVTRRPRPVRERRPEVPEALSAALDRMLAKNPWERFQTPRELVKALEAWTAQPIEPPPPAELPQLSFARDRTEHPSSKPSTGGRSWVIKEGVGSGSAETLPQSTPIPSASNKVLEESRPEEKV
jgi:serine/threonine protein kinase